MSRTRTYTAEQLARTREYNRAYYQANKEKMTACQAKWREANPEKVKAYDDKWREANKEKANALSKQWYEANKEKENRRRRSHKTAERKDLKPTYVARVLRIETSLLLEHPQILKAKRRLLRTKRNLKQIKEKTNDNNHR